MLSHLQGTRGNQNRIIRSLGIVGGSMLPGVVLGVSKAYTWPSCSLYPTISHQPTRSNSLSRLRSLQPWHLLTYHSKESQMGWPNRLLASLPGGDCAQEVGSSWRAASIPLPLTKETLILGLHFNEGSSWWELLF